MDHGPPYFPVRRKLKPTGKFNISHAKHMVLERHNMLETLYAHLPLALHEKMKVMKPSSSSVDSVIFAALKICCCTACTPIYGQATCLRNEVPACIVKMDLLVTLA
ncbi:hypothetical protein OIU84_025052 [Salix udensis]|uniref:Uncharacterized protein n=1 Tax=Salix udensis TaxID=889485 RepID=A0AAD6KIM2_9ROSI|nr:hypothetical protein OIU84_025052 [Salix udensis]